MLSIALLVAAAPTVVVHLAEVDGVKPELARDLVDRFAEAIELRTGAPCIQSNPEWEQCSSPGACIESIRASARADDVVLMRVFGGALSILVSAERYEAGNNTDAERHNFNVDRKRLDDVELTRLASHFYATGTRTSTKGLTLNPEFGPPEPINWAPIALAGLAAGAGAGALALGLSANSAKSQLENTVQMDGQHARLTSRLRGHAAGANTLIAVASASAVGALIWWILD